MSLHSADDSPVPLGTEPTLAEAFDALADDGLVVFPRPTDPMAVARQVLQEYVTPEGLALRTWRGCWMRWQGAQYVEAEAGELRGSLYTLLETAVWVKVTKDDLVYVPWEPN